MTRPTVSQSTRTRRHRAVLSMVVARHPTRSSESLVNREPARAKVTSSVPALGGTVDPTEIGPNFEAPPAQIEVPPRRGDRAGVVTGIGRVLALGAVPLPASQLDGDHHSGRLEDHGGDRHPGQVHEALQCSGDANGIGLLGSVGVATPNLETIRARHPDTRCERRAHLLRPRSRNGRRGQMSPLLTGFEALVLHEELPDHIGAFTHMHAGRPEKERCQE